MSIEARMSIAEEGLAVILRSNRKLDWRTVSGKEAASDAVQFEYVFNERISGFAVYQVCEIFTFIYSHLRQ